MPRITVITPTIRPEMMEMTHETLRRQTFRDFEHIVVIGSPGNGFTLPKDYNYAIRKAQGEIVVSLQDCIELEPDFLEKVSKMDFSYKAYTFPVGKRLVSLNGTEAVSWDWRAFRDGEVGDQQWEIDLAACHRDLFYEIGGFDESYCDGWSYDNVEVGIRAYAAGYRFFCVPDMRGTAVDHDKLAEHPFREKLRSNSWRVSITRDMAEQNLFKLDNL